jgi:hypothetical protein
VSLLLKGAGVGLRCDKQIDSGMDAAGTDFAFHIEKQAEVSK